MKDIQLSEELVKSRAIFVLHYTKGHFKSTNRRRGIYAAAEMNKPSILMFSNDESILDAMKEQCAQYWDSDKVESIIFSPLGHSNRASTNGSIQWLDEDTVSVVTISHIYHYIFRYVSYYITYQNELEQAIIVPGVMFSGSFDHSINMLVFEDNVGCI